MIHRALVIFIILLTVPTWQAAALAQGNAVFTQEQANRLAPGFAQQCAAEIAGAMSLAGIAGLPRAEKMRSLDSYVGESRSELQKRHEINKRWAAENNYKIPQYNYAACGGEYVLAHWDDTASNNRSTTRPRATPKPALKAAAPAKKLPPARPAKMAPWSTKAMPTDSERALSPKYAAERVDALASCFAPIQQFAEQLSISSTEAALIVEQMQLEDGSLGKGADFLKKHLVNLQSKVTSGELTENAYRVAACTYGRRIAQLEGSPLAASAIDGTLTPLSIGGQAPPWKQQGKDARIIASDGKSAMDCVKLVELTKTDSGMSGGGRVLSNQCSGPVEIGWCYSPGDCDTETGSGWTLQPGRSWPVSAEKPIRWAACHGANTSSFVKGSHGLRYYCSAPAKK